jgi:hypothetical protein
MALPATFRVQNQWSFSMVGGGGSPALGTGTASTFALSGLERESDSDRRPGAAGALFYGGDFNEVTATITLVSLTDSLRTAILESVCSNVTVTLSAIFEDVRDNCSIAAYTASMRGIITKYPMFEFSSDRGEAELMIGVNRFEDAWKGKTWIYDPDNMIYSYNGVNLWADRKTALGI